MMNAHSNYEIFEEIGRTESTVVYRAHDLNLGRDVAIKELTSAGKADPKRQERLLREAQFLAQTEHAGILRIHTVVPENGWVVMELMKGSLEAQIQHAAMDADTVRSILRQLLSALDFLHSKNKIHGAIRPSNILIDENGSVRLSDFDATDLDGELRPPQSTQKYLSPECILADFGDLGPASDLYCLAFTALELLVGPEFDSKLLRGQAAASGADVAWLRVHSGDEPLPNGRDLLSTIPPDLAGAIDAMLCKHVADRPATASDALARLDEQPIVIVEPVPVAAGSKETAGMMPAGVATLDPMRPVTKPTPLGQASPGAGKRFNDPSEVLSTRERLNQTLEKPYVLYPLCGLMLLMALGIGLALRQDSPIDEPERIAKLEVNEVPLDGEREASQAESTTLPNPSQTELETPIVQTTVEPEVNDDISTETMPESVTTEQSAPPQPPATTAPATTKPEKKPAETTLPETKNPEPTDLPPESDEAIRRESTPIDSEPETYVNPLAGFMELVSKESELDTSKLLDEFKGDPELVIDAGGFLSEASDVAIDPLGRWVAASGEKVVRLWELRSGKLVHTLRGDRSRTSYGDCNTLAFSPDGQYLVVGVGDYQPHGSIRVYRTDHLDEIDALLPGHTSPVRQIGFSRDGASMISSDADGNVAVWDWQTQSIRHQISPRDPQSPIIDELMFPGQDGVVMGIDFGGPFLLETPSLRRLSANDPLSSRLYAWMFDLLTRKLQYPFGTTDDPRVVDLKLDEGLWAAAGAGKDDRGNQFWISLWRSREREDNSPPQRGVVYTGHRWKVRSIDLAPKQNLAASCDMFGEVHVWSLEDGRQLHRLRPQGKPIYEAAFDRQSSRIAFGTKPHAPDTWKRNNFGSIDRVLDLAKRAIYRVDPQTEIEPIQETPQDSTSALTVKRVGQSAGLSLVKQTGGTEVSRYDLTTGRSPTTFSLLDQPILDVRSPVLLGDSEGLLAVWNSDSDELKRAFIGHDAMVTSISVAPHGRTMLSGSSDRTIRLWSLEDVVPTGIFDFKFENVSVTAVVPGSTSAKAGVQVGDRIERIDGKTMKEMYERMLTGTFNYRPGQTVPVEMSRDGQPYRFDMEMNEGYDFSEPILSVYIGDHDRWIAWTPRGYYDAAPGAENLIGWHINRGPDKSAAYFDVGQFREQLYRPDIIDRLLTGQKIDEAVEQANARREQTAVDFRSPSDLAENHPPEIEILSPVADQPSSGRSVQVEAKITSPNGLPIREVTLLVNGIATATIVPDSPVATNLMMNEISDLIPGDNTIEIIASNTKSRGVASILVPFEGGAPDSKEKKPNLIVLAIGVSDRIDDSDADARPNAIRDAQVFVDALSEQASFDMYREVSSKVLMNDQATRARILDGFQWLVDQTESGDTVAIYLAADAFVDSSENFYIGAQDADTRRPRATALSWREFIKTLQVDLPACKRLVFLDLEPTTQAIEPGQRNPLLDLAAPELGTVFFSSTALQQRLPKRRPGSPGVLTSALQRTLSDASTDVAPNPPDGLVSCEEASQAWMSRVRVISDNKLYPVAFSPAAFRDVNVFQLSKLIP